MTEKELLKEVWSMWESLAECGEIKIGPQFSANYARLKGLVREELGSADTAKEGELELYEPFDKEFFEYLKVKNFGHAALTVQAFIDFIEQSDFYILRRNPEAQNQLSERNGDIELLEAYSKYLEKNGYMDTDWRTETPYTIDEFLNDKKILGK